MQTRPARRRRCSAAARTPTKRSTTGASCRRSIKWGNTHGVVEDSQGNIYVHHTVHATSESADSMVVFDQKGQVRPVVGQGVQGRRARPAHPQGRQRRVPLPHGERRESAPDAAAGDAGGGRQGDAERGDRLEDPGPPDVDAHTSRRPTARRSATTRPTSRSRRTATSTSATATARTYVNQYNSKAEYIRTFGGKGVGGRASSREPHGIWVDTRGAAPILRRRRSAQQPAAALHARRRAHRLRHRLPAAVPLRRAEGHGRHSRSARPRDADRQRATASSSTSATRTRPTGTTRCAPSRARRSSPASSSARTAPASITTATSSSWSGSRSDG